VRYDIYMTLGGKGLTFAPVWVVAPKTHPTVGFSASATGTNVNMFLDACRICTNVTLPS
jgi:hypothetical protein